MSVQDRQKEKESVEERKSSQLALVVKEEGKK